MRRPKLLIVKTGSAAEEIVRAHRDFEDWFIQALGVPERFSVAKAYGPGPDEVPPLPAFAAYDGLLVTGSPLSVTAPTPWMDALAARLRDHAGAGGAVLGVCFGHQLLSHAFGTPVVRNPAGREIGTIDLTLTAEGRADELFEGLPAALTVNATHVDHASAVPAGTVLLAANGKSAVQAVRFGARARGVQFHPEITVDAMRALIRSRAAPMREEGLDPEAHDAAVLPSLQGDRVLRHFEERLCGRG
jgi:GMP synthase (glutamine-hydrolysing)